MATMQRKAHGGGQVRHHHVKQWQEVCSWGEQTFQSVWMGKAQQPPCKPVSSHTTTTPTQPPPRLTTHPRRPCRR